MTIAGIQAWVTSAVNDKAVNKAIVLAGSLRRVHTAKKLAVFTTLAVSKELREKLKVAFDLVLLLEQETPNGLNLEDYAKVQSFSLLVFNKCVYLSPNTLVLKNCDEIFEKYETFAAGALGKDIDPTVYVYSPSLDHSRALEKIVHYVDSAGDRAKGDFQKYFNVWMKNHIPKSEKLDEKYNLRIDLERSTSKSMEVDVTIANFTAGYPLDLPKEILLKKLNEVGPVEKFALESCLKIHGEDVKMGVDNELATFTRDQIENEPIAIVGMSFRLPGGNTVDEFWDLMISGREAIRVLPPFRWKKEHISRQCNNRNIEAGFLNIPLDEFDAKFFGISPKEAEFLDPQQRLLHEVTWEAMEDAMIDPHTLRGTQTGVFVGSWIHDYKDISLKSADVDFFRVYMGNSIAAESARLSHFLETTGPSIATESGCSSAIVAVHMACKSLQKHESSMAIAGGVNLLIHPFDQNTLSFVLAPDGRCKTFDANANGFGRAEACAVLVMKRLSDAVKDGDNIWGMIRGSGVVQEGVSKSLGTPTVHCESLAMELALKDSGVDPKDISYIEAHGTGTSVGDPLEIAAITKAYSKGRTEPVVIGSVKTNVGHTESVSGITGIIKVLLSMKKETIPPHRNLQTLNPAINLGAIPAEIPMRATPWPKQTNKPRIAGVSSFGISGTDGHAIVQEPPTIPEKQIDYKLKRPLHLLKISAKSPESMEQLISEYEAICTEKAKKDDEEEFANLAYSANTGRATFNHRTVVVANNFSQAAKIFKEKTFKLSDTQVSRNELCFLFTGQGSQYPNMAASLYATSPVFRDSFDKCDEVLANRYSINMREVLWGKQIDGVELSRTLYSQTSIFCIEYCLLKLWESWGVKPDYVMGHSLGEFAAAVAAGALDFEDALMLVAERSRLIDSLPRGKMLVIKADKKTVDQTITKYQQVNPKFWVDYAALNSPDQTVVAGDSTMIEAFAKYCGERNLKTIVLAATHAFHSRHMDPILQTYRNVARTVKKLEVNEDAPQYISGMEGKLMEIDSIDSEYWVRHTREKVSFIDACRVASSEGCSLFLEVGPHPVLSALAMMNIEGQSVTCLPSIRRKEDEWVTMLDSLTKLYLSDWKGEIDWKGFDRYYKRSRVSCLPFYPFNRKPVWIKTRHTPGNLHPLLGKLLPNASGRSVFENELTIKNVNYVQDHVIGNTVVFPGAGFLEMCLSGGYSSVQGATDDLIIPRRPVVLKGLKIKSPLALYESNFSVLQTIVSLDEKDEEMGYNVNIFRHDDTDPSAGGQWIPHASGKFLPVAPALESHITSKVDIASIQSSWQKSDNKDFYDKLPEVVLRFGPKFQSLESGWKSEEGVLLRVKVPEDCGSYLIHPVVADAMIQAEMLWTSKEKLKKKLQVPVHIEEFVWLNSSQSTEIYIYCSSTQSGKSYATLLDEDGNPLAYMGSVDFAETTVKLVEGMIEQQATAMPQLWEEVWRNAPGPMQNSLILDNLTTSKEISPETQKRVDALNRLPETEKHFYKSICTFTRLHFLDAMYNLGWKPEMGKWFTVNDIVTSLKIPKQYHNYSRFFLKSMAMAEGLLEIVPDKAQNHKFRVVKKLPTSEEIAHFIKATVTPYFVDRAEYKIIENLGQNFNKIISGKEEPLTYLFPRDPKKANAGEFYESVGKQTRYNIRDIARLCILPRLAEATRLHQQTHPTEKHICRVLEVGAGTGSFTECFIEALDEYGVEFEYTYTDVSAAFFTQAEKMFEGRPKSVIFKKFNMEEDPLEQGFCPEYYDVAIGCEVLHVAKDLKKVLHNIRSLLKVGGLLQIAETVQQDPRITFIFGLLDGYWQFEDYDIRPDHATLTIPKWKEVFEASGYADVVGAAVYEDVHGYVYGFTNEHRQLQAKSLKYMGEEKHSWVLFSDNTPVASRLEAHLKSVNRKVVVVTRPKSLTEEQSEKIVTDAMAEAAKDKLIFEGIIYLWSLSSDINDNDQSTISLPFVHICQNISTMITKPPRLYSMTQGIHSIEDSEILNPSPGSVVGIAKAVSNEDTQLNLFHFDLSPENLMDQMEEICSNLWVTNNATIALRNGKRFISRLASTKIPNEYLSIPNGCDRFQLVLPKTRVISDLEFGYLDPYPLGDYDVEIHVKAMALNFRDVFSVLKPIKQFEDLNTVGLDFAGIVTKLGPKVTKRQVGDRVIGMNLNKDLSLPSHIKQDENLVVTLTDKLTYAEGVTLPAVFSTVIYCLITTANMKRGETLLIHTATGGVGLCAIQMAQRLGVNIIATAGSKRKRNYLHNLGIKHVFNSRTTDFGKQILEVTNGKGVDIVLNSITGEGFKEASLGALSHKGRFIEMSKLNIWDSEEVKKLRPDVFYRVVDLTSLEREEYEELTETLTQHVKEELVQPLAFEIFDALNIRGALYYLQKAKHIGKIVCLMPELKVENSKIITQTPLFNEYSTYLITGGLGGIGFEVVKYMLENGAKHVAIISRSKPKPDIQNQIDSWNKAGKHVQAFAVDIGNFEQCKNLFEQLKSPSLAFPRLRGVMHAAGVLNDATIRNQSWATFKQTYNPKINGTWNLHKLTKDLILEHFVVFSSIAAVLGSPGQANHSASNSFEDAFAHYRRSIGLPGTSINWGNWGEVGVATEVDLPGVRPISTTQGLLALETFLKTQRSHTAVLNSESFALMIKLFPQLKNYIDDKRLLGESKSAVIINSDEFWSRVDNAQSPDEKLEVFKLFIKTTVKGILKMDGDEDIDDNADFQTLGIDSLMMLEMKNSLQNVLGARLTLTAAQLKDCTNTQTLAAKLISIMEGEDSEDQVLPTMEELRELIREDSTLPDHICAGEGMPVKDVSQIQSIFLTGVTGTLGPYLLRELSHRPAIKKIYCLIRKSGKMSPSERLLKRLEQAAIEKEVNLSKVEYIQGDITDSQFGLSEEEYNKLAKDVDAIVHSAVRADHIAKYYKSPDTKKLDVRTVNVKGTIRMLEFSTHVTVKHFYDASTLLTVTKTDEGGCLSEEWQDVGAFDELVNFNPGYPLSKHISEQLVKQAVERGVPCKCFRLGFVGGDSRTGRCEYLTNHVILRWLAYMKLKCMPDMPAPLLAMPVDHCAKISLDVFFNPRALPDVYNIIHTDAGMDQTLIAVAHELGIEIEPVSLEEFVAQIKLESDASPLAPFKKMYMEDMQEEQFSSVQCLKNYVENPADFFRSRKLPPLIQNYDQLEPTDVCMRRDIRFLKETGVFEKFGINSA